jgi:hypothetical protein
MPVQVGITLLAAKAQAVHPLGRHDRGHRHCDPAHHALQRQVLILAEVVNPVFDMPLGCHQAVAEQGGVAD